MLTGVRFFRFRPCLIGVKSVAKSGSEVALTTPYHVVYERVYASSTFQVGKGSGIWRLRRSDEILLGTLLDGIGGGH